MIVRLAEIEVYPQYLKEYLEFANEVDRLSVEREPGVVCLYPMQTAEDSCQIRILEIYASEEAYQQHLNNETDIQKTKIIYEDYYNHYRAATGSGEHKCTREDERECEF